ncbi:tetratricopeptide repeat-containing sulfotransferase family protein [Luteolibacter soli]|uniref:Sulfotransferase n=1 Tax=Luteolibacter soli TaxID=3135280 RepID=A0ABU9B0T3_9BACT
MKGTLAELQRSPQDAGKWQRTQQLLLGRQYESALAGYEALVKRYPRIAELWFELGNAAAGTLDFPLANRAFRKALDLAPNHSSLIGLIGQQYQNLRQLDDARECYARALAANPDSVDARINLAVWFEKERRLEEAWECIGECLKRHPRDDQARYFHAFLLHRRKQPAEAEQALRDLIADGPRYPYVKYASRHLLGVVLDELGRPEEAMRWVLEAKAEVRTITDTAVLERSYDQQDRQRRELLSSLDSPMLARWRAEAPASDEGVGFAFLGGHPRSGTTLLEQILDAHPEVTAFDESVAFAQEIQGPLEVIPPGLTGIQHLDSLAVTDRGRMRHRYATSLMREIPPGSKTRLVLDKNPSPTLALPAWLRIFPDLKVIIALRDPRDVVISCFFLNLMLNTTNVNFLRLERTVKHYEDLMGLWLRMKDLGNFDWIETRYEDLVENTETEGRKATALLGLEWNESQGRYFETARRKVLYAPTYHDVTRPIYRTAVRRWERYAGALEPFQERLAPYCRAFGYDA